MLLRRCGGCDGRRGPALQAARCCRCAAQLRCVLSPCRAESSRSRSCRSHTTSPSGSPAGAAACHRRLRRRASSNSRRSRPTGSAASASNSAVRQLHVSARARAPHSTGRGIWRGMQTGTGRHSLKRRAMESTWGCEHLQATVERVGLCVGKQSCRRIPWDVCIHRREDLLPSHTW